MQQEQRDNSDEQLPVVRYYGLLILIACAFGLLIASLILSLFNMY